MREIFVGGFLNFIREQMELGDLTPIMGLGKSGIGKTEGIAELCKDMGIGFCELRLVTMTETDLLGVPDIVPDPEDLDEKGLPRRYTDWASNKLLPFKNKDGAKGILVLDEITSAGPNIRAAAYQLLDSKRALGNYKLPDDWLVVALGNDVDDGGTYNGMEAAFANRCLVFRVEPEFECWKKWAIKHEVNPTVIGFLQFQPEMLHNRPEDSTEYVFPSPRSWVALARMMSNREKLRGGKSLDPADVSTYASCSVGESAANAFEAFYEYNADVVSAYDIIEGKVDADKTPVQDQILIIIGQSLVRVLNDLVSKEFPDDCMNANEKVLKSLANTINWITKLGDRRVESAVALMQEIVEYIPKTTLIFTDLRFEQICPRFMEFCTKNSVVVKASKR